MKNKGNNECQRAQNKSSFHNKLLESMNKMAKAGEWIGHFKEILPSARNVPILFRRE
jgi:hypothetical protein